MNGVIRIEGVTKRFGEVVALDNVSCEVRENEFLALLGPSGCGKTTLLRAIAGLEQPDAGHIFIDNLSQDGRAPYERPVNMMFQSYALFPHMTVADNVAFGLKQDGLRGDALAERVREALARVEMEALAARKPQQLSGGQKQRVALARCLAKRPRALLLDEPLAALDKHLRERTQLELMALRERLGITFIVVTHDQDEAMGMAGRVAVMDKGRILQVGTPRELYDRPLTRTVAGFFGHMNIWEGTVETPDRVACAVGAVRVAAPLPRAGARVAVAVRPEQIALQAVAGQSGENHFAGTVADVVYGGTISTYFVLREGQRIRVVRQNGAGPAFERGAAVTASWPAAAVRVLAP
ncbi:MAG: ABC transporter ATP-binding protein [Rhodospirillaceae bacterium]|nr:ABC transporter ATP-binding protein [Rhodospirillaceae bacterium]